MGRHSLRIIMVLGVLVTLVGGTGIFAVFTDRATAGQNSVASGPRAKAADLKIEAGLVVDASGGVLCDEDGDAMPFEDDDTTTAQLTATDLQPGSLVAYGHVCLYNAGSATLADVTASVIELTDVDDACTGDEEAAGDATCGASGVGELSGLLTVFMETIDCNDGQTLSPGETDWLNAFVDEPVSGAVISMASGETRCLRFSLAYPTPASEEIAQQAQTDSVTWRFAFDATAS